MKRLTALLLALVMVFALCACGGPGDEPTGNPDPSPEVSDTNSPEPSGSADSVVIDGLVTQLVTVNLLGNDIPVTVVRDASTFEFTYQFMGNDVYAKGIIGEDGTWTINDTNNDFSSGTLDLLLPAIDEAAWKPVSSPEASADGPVTQLVVVNLLGTDVEVTVNKDGSNFEFTYQFMGNDVYAKGTIEEDGTWTINDTNNDFSSGTLDLLLPAIDETAWKPVSSSEAPADGPVTQLVVVNLLGTDVEVTVNKDGSNFEFTYQFMGNDVYAKGTIGEDGTWTINDTNNDFSSGTLDLLLPAIDESSWVAIGVSGPVAQTVIVDLMGNRVEIYVVKDGSAFEFNYQFMGNDVYAKGTVGEDGKWNIEDTNNDFTVGTLDLLLPAIDEAAWAPVSGGAEVGSGESDGIVLTVNLGGYDVDVNLFLSEGAYKFTTDLIYASGTIDAEGNWISEVFAAGAMDADGNYVENTEVVQQADSILAAVKAAAEAR